MPAAAAEPGVSDATAQRIVDVSATPISIPLDTAVRFSTRGVQAREYVIVTIVCEDGERGTGYTYAGTTGAAATAVFVMTCLRPSLRGRLCNPAKIWDLLYRETLLAGRRGMGLRAISAVDLAIWDLLGKRHGLPLYALLGGTREPVRAYASGGYYRPGSAVDNVERELSRYAELGFTDFKIKVGGADLDVDVDRVRAARNIVGQRGRLALDANNAWPSAREALRFIAAVERFDPWWIEEPLMPDDVHGHAEIRRRSSVPIATGEIHATRWDFRDLISADAADILQPDACVVGGVSEWMKVANTASVFGLPVAPHWNANVHVHLAAAVDNCLAIEYFSLDEDIFNFERVLAERLAPEEGSLLPPARPGLGLLFDEAAVESYRIS